MGRIKTTNGGYFSVDDKYVAWISRLRWMEDADRPNGAVYFYTSLASKKVYLHRLIIALHGRFDVDHKNRDRRDNSLGNLRIATRSQNASNATHKKKSSLPRGVHSASGKFHASIEVRGVRYRRHGFATPEDAGRAYDEMAKDHYGEFATLNFEKDSYE